MKPPRQIGFFRLKVNNNYICIKLGIFYFMVAMLSVYLHSEPVNSGNMDGSATSNASPPQGQSVGTGSEPPRPVSTTAATATAAPSRQSASRNTGKNLYRELEDLPENMVVHLNEAN